MTDLRPAQDAAAEHIGACELVYPVYCRRHASPIDRDAGWCDQFAQAVALIDARDAEHEANRQAVGGKAWNAGYEAGYHDGTRQEYHVTASPYEAADD